MLEASGTFYMVYKYSYDGHTSHNDPIFPASEYAYAMDYLQKLYREEDSYEWNTEEELRRLLPGQYSYETVYIEEMTMNEEIL